MIITRTPLRVSFAGGGTDIRDYYERRGGAVVSAAIGKYVYVAVNRSFDGRIRVRCSETEAADDVEELRHELARECLKLVGVRGGVEITSMADVPAGTGLGSSSAFAVGLLNALRACVGDSPSAGELARQACRVEIDILKHPIGKQDQYAAACGGINYFRFNPDGSVDRRQISLDDRSLHSMQRKLLLFYTGTTRSADAILAEQRRNADAKLEALDFMRSQADAMYAELTANGFNARFGDALHQGWLRKRSLAASISNQSINEYYERGIAAGARGGKLLGAGGGGFLLFYCDEERQAAVARALGLPQVKFRVCAEGSRVIFSE